jgi:peptide/nickel transport system substrate-binding protein
MEEVDVSDSILARTRITRRGVLAGSVAASIAAIMPQLLIRPTFAQATPDVADSITIDLEVEPTTLDPALTNDLNGWSVVHSIYDSLVNLSPSGEAEPLLAESVTFPDPLTCRIVLRSDRVFQDGSPVNADSVQAMLDHIRDPKTASQVVDNFAVIDTLTIVDPLTVDLALSTPAPWLLSQMAPWWTPFPPSAAANLGQQPVGAGPFKFVSWTPGESLIVEADPNYPADSPKGQPIAKRVTFRFVPEPSTRVADLLSNSVSIVRSVPPDQASAVESGGAKIVTQPVTGIAFVRVANDVAPFTDARVRQALNHAVDVDTIIAALLNGNGSHLASLFPEGGMGYDANLAPMAFDPDKAKSLLADAGFPDGFETTLETSDSEPNPIAEAIAGMLGDVGIKVTVKPIELATFNATWKDATTAPLRYVSWRPMNDPYTLLSLVFSNAGFLSRFNSETLQPLIDSGAIETNQAKRAEIYQQLGAAMQQDPPAIFINSLVSLYGVAADLPAWTSRNDDYTIPTHVG